ncbi:MAG: Gfo/Idh/MocA family oxidoreductase [Clostridiales bacterium]|nr:Gfo/Idh/MocA family oxidoreductase [Clostridiales bacterium]
MRNEVRWGVLGCAGIARKAMLPAILDAGNAKLYAIASRSREKLAEMAKLFPCERQYVGYEALLGDPAVDAVYIPLPNSLHCEWVVKALEMGKPVLCEKPLAMNAAEVRRVMEASRATGVPAMEAFAYLHDPLMARAREVLASGALGRLRYMEANFSYLLEDLSNVRLIRGIGGGATYDLGCYPISFFRALAGEEPSRVAVSGRRGARSGVDEDVLVLLDFPSGAKATSYFSFQAHWNTRNLVLGECGYMEFPTIFDRGDKKTLILETASGGRSVETLDTSRRYALQVEQMGRVVLEGRAPAVSLGFSLGNAEVLDSILAECGD